MTEENSTTEAPDEIEPKTTGRQENDSERPMPREQRYRLELRAAEAQRDELAQRVEQLQTREVERLASKHLSAPADLLTLGGVTVAGLLDDEGNVDPDKVSDVAAEVLGARPGLKPLSPAHDPSQGTGGEPIKSGPRNWADLLKV